MFLACWLQMWFMFSTRDLKASDACPLQPQVWPVAPPWSRDSESGRQTGDRREHRPGTSPAARNSGTTPPSAPTTCPLGRSPSLLLLWWPEPQETWTPNRGAYSPLQGQVSLGTGANSGGQQPSSKPDLETDLLLLMLPRPRDPGKTVFLHSLGSLFSFI